MVHKFENSPIKEAYLSGSVLTGVVGEKSGNGHKMSVLGFSAFMPRWMEIPGNHVSPGQEVNVCVASIPPESKSMIVSTWAAEEPRIRELSKKHYVGEVVRVRTLSVGTNQILVSIEDGLTGTISLKEYTHVFIKAFNLVANVGNEFDAKIIRIHEKRGHLLIELSKKQLTSTPSTDDSLSVGDIVEGEVVSLRHYGAFVTIGTVLALLHRSELSWTEKEPEPQSVLSFGDRIRVKIISLNLEKNKIAVSLREALPNPWESEALSQGTVFEGRVTKRLGFGVIVASPYGPSGLLHVSKLADTLGEGMRLLKTMCIGDVLQVKVESINSTERRMDLTLL